MITFIVFISLLIIGYFTYGAFIDKFFGADPEKETPAIKINDGVDYTPLKPWKIFVIQFLNIAGLGPIFGAIMGAAYGPIAYIWIVLGCIFMGATHDYVSGMLSIRNNGMSLPAIIGKYLGNGFSRFIIFFTVFLLMAVGASFVNGPSGLLANLTGWDFKIWLYVVFAYYIIATLLPVDKIIGKIYPFMGGALLFMAVGIGVMIIVTAARGETHLVELTPETFRNFKSNGAEYMLFPLLFIVISCGAISGFHATQSPMMARCMCNEKYGRKIFYGAMITEGIVACIWATAAMAYYNGPEGLNIAADSGSTPAIIVNSICETWLGKVGAVVAIIGVVVCPITSGDTAFRSMRLIIADILKFSQKPIKNRLIVSVPIFILAYIICNIDFSIIWTYVGIGNQILATITLWACAAYFVTAGKPHWYLSIPATFLTYVCICFFLVAPNIQGGLNLSSSVGHIAAMVITTFIFILFIYNANKKRGNRG